MTRTDSFSYYCSDSTEKMRIKRQTRVDLLNVGFFFLNRVVGYKTANSFPSVITACLTNTGAKVQLAEMCLTFFLSFIYLSAF